MMIKTLSRKAMIAGLVAPLVVAGAIVATEASAATETPNDSGTGSCDSYASTPVDGGSYTVQTNRWNSNATECVSTDGGSDFTVSASQIDNPTNGAPGGYPSIYRGCHWSACTQNDVLPIQASDIGSATSTWHTTQPDSGAYDVAYDIWFNSTEQPGSSGPDGAEVMVWINDRGGVSPAGSKVATVDAAGATWDVWYNNPNGHPYIAYVREQGTASVDGLDLAALIRDAISRQYVDPATYLVDVEAGFEIWQGGQSLATNSFSFDATPTQSQPST